MALSTDTFTLLGHHPHHPSPELSHLPKLKLCPHETLTLHPPPPVPGPHHLLPVSVDLTPLGTSHKWNQTVFILLCLAYFSEQRNKVHHVLKVHPCCRMGQIVLPFQGGITVHCMDGLYFVYPVIFQWTLGLFPSLGCCE